MFDSLRNSCKWWKVLTSPWFSLAFILFAVIFFDRLRNGVAWPVRIFTICGILWLAYTLVRQFVRLWKKKKNLAVFAVILLVFYYAVFELGCFIFDKAVAANDESYVADDGLALSKQSRKGLERLVSGEQGFYQIDPITGWSIRTGDSHKWAAYEANSNGIRASRNYDKEKPSGITRISCNGDSYTFGAEVSNGETWPDYLQDKLSGNYEVINFGVPGTGLVQSYLRYKEIAQAYESDIVIIGFMSNNIQRNLNAFRPFLVPETGFPLAKPYGTLDEDKRLVLNPPPLKSVEDYQKLLDDTYTILRQIAQKDYYVRDKFVEQPTSRFPSHRVWIYLSSRTKIDDNIKLMLKKSNPYKKKRAEPYKPDGYAIKIAAPLFEKYANAVKAVSAKPIVVIFPNALDIRDSNRGKPVRYEILKNILREKNIETVDVLELFRDTYGETIPLEKIYRRAHYNPETNLLIAEHLTDFITSTTNQSTSRK